jgi:short-subunit dehydrogenase
MNRYHHKNLILPAFEQCKEIKRFIRKINMKILVTGASRGIGKATAKLFADLNHEVIGTSRDPKGWDERIKMYPLDITNQSSVVTLQEELGSVDVLVNNAGYDLYGAAEETSMDELQEQIETNFYGAVRMIRQFLPGMRKQGYGKIINISSLGGYIGLPYNSAYAASKFALEGYSESLRMELLPFGIYVSLVSPEAVATESLDTSIREIQQHHSSYEAASTAMMKELHAQGTRSPVSSQAVSKQLAKIVKNKSPHLRYFVGQQSRWIPKLKQLFPQAMFEAMIKNQFKKALNKYN